jgi:hypothetical protein
MDIVEFAESITGFKMLPHQTEFLRQIESDDTANAVVKAPRGGGKTFMAAIICAYYLTHRNNYKIVIAAGSREQAGRMMGYLHEWFFGPLMKYTKHKKNIGRNTIYVPERRNKLTLIATSQASRRGEHANMLIIDEAESIEEEVILEYLGIPTLNPSRIIVLSTPIWDKTFTFFKHLYGDAEKYGYRQYSWTSEHSKQIPGWVNAYEREKSKATYNKAWFRTQWEGEFDVAEGLVFQGLDKCIISGKSYENRPQPINGHPIRIGIDWGYTHHTAVVISQKVRGHVYILESFGFQGVTYNMITQHIRNKYEKYREYTSDIAVISDASGMGNEKVEEFTLMGVNVVGVPFMAEKMSYLIPNAVSWVENARVRIWEGESKLLSQMSTYYWETSSSGAVKTKKTGDDYVDAFLLSLRDWRFMNVLEEERDTDKPYTIAETFIYNETAKLLDIIAGQSMQEMRENSGGGDMWMWREA